MENLPLISVIVPVYKVEQYLDKCISSIVNQTYKNLEIILVNDGSPDNSGAICDDWAEKDGRIKVIHKENGGSGKARNVALDIARGRYIAFVDSDDYISPLMLEHLYGLFAPDVDIVECEFISVSGDHESFSVPSDPAHQEYAACEAMAFHIADNMFRQIIWNKLYRRETIANVRFPVDTRIDDEFWTYRVLANAGKVVHSNCIMYAYRQQPNSVMHQSFSMHRLQAVDAKCQRLELIKEQFPELLSSARINLWGTCVYLGQMSLLHMDKAERTLAFNKLQAVCAQYPLTREDKQGRPFKRYVWAALSDISFIAVCKLRNFLKIGL